MTANRHEGRAVGSGVRKTEDRQPALIGHDRSPSSRSNRARSKGDGGERSEAPALSGLADRLVQDGTAANVRARRLVNERVSSAKSAKSTSLEKALEVMMLLGTLGIEYDVHLSQIVSAAGISRPTAYRFLKTMCKYDLARRNNATGLYRLGPKIMILNSQLTGEFDIRERALPFLQELVFKSGVTAHLGVTDGTHMIYIEKVESREPIRLATGVGWSGALHSTALGKALLAHQPRETLESIIRGGLSRQTEKTLTKPADLLTEIERIQRNGYAVDNEENEPGVRCISAPVFNYSGNVVAAISVSGTISQLPAKNVPSVAKLVLEGATKICEAIGYRKPDRKAVARLGAP